MDLKTFVNALFVNKRAWAQISDKEKESYFFIFNRYMAKRHPLSAQKFNRKGVDKASAMDVWFETFKRDIRVPAWFWAGGKQLRKKTPAEAHAAVLGPWHGMRPEDALLLAELFPEDAKQEAARIERVQAEKDKA
jgi:hypothetical protein